MSRSVKTTTLRSDKSISLNEILDLELQRSRYTSTETSNHERVDQIDDLLAGLTPRQREVAEMHGIGGMTFSEIARVLGIDRNGVMDAWQRVVTRITGVEQPMVMRKREAEKRRSRKQRAIKRRKRRRADWFRQKYNELLEEERRTGITPPKIEQSRSKSKERRELIKKLRQLEAETGYTDPRLASYREQDRIHQAKRRAKKKSLDV